MGEVRSASFRQPLPWRSPRQKRDSCREGSKPLRRVEGNLGSPRTRLLSRVGSRRDGGQDLGGGRLNEVKRFSQRGLVARI